MREVIQRVVEAEAEGRRFVAAARAEAERLRAEAQGQARELLERTQAEVRVAAAQLVATTVEEAEREKQEKIAQATPTIAAAVRLDGGTRQRLVDAIIRCVTGRR